MVKFRFYDPDDEKPAPVREQPVQPIKHARSGGLVLDWHDELDWKENPFTLHAPAHALMAGREDEKRKINVFFVKNLRFGTLQGEKGSGVTTLVHWMFEELKAYSDRYDVRLLHGSATPQAFCKAITAPYERMLVKCKNTTPEGLAEFLHGKMKKQLVIIVDDADENTALALYYRSLLFSGATVILAGVNPPQLQNDGLAITLTALSDIESRDLVAKRIQLTGGEGIMPFTNELLSELWSASKKNIPQYLHLCAETAMRIALKEYTPPTQEETMQKPVSPSKSSRASESKTKPAKQNAYDDLIASLTK